MSQSHFTTTCVGIIHRNMNAQKLFLPRIRLGRLYKGVLWQRFLYSTLTAVRDGAPLFTKSRSQQRTASANGIFVQNSTLFERDSMGTVLCRVRHYFRYIQPLRRHIPLHPFDFFLFDTLLINQAQLTLLLNFSWLAWTCDSIDLYSLSFVAGSQGQYIAKEFKKTPHQVVRSSFRTLFQ